MPGAGKGIRGASLAHALLFLSALHISLLGSCLRGGAPHRFRREPKEQREGALPCVLPENTKPTLYGVGLSSLGV